MTERYLFFNSAHGDKRTHQASDIAKYWQQILTNGIFHLDQVPKLKVTASTNDMRVTIEPGSANINGYFYFNDADMFKFIEGADALLDRIDRVVLRWDNTIEHRYIKVFVLKGVPSSNPVPPQLTRTEDIHELSLAQVRVRAGKSFIEQSDMVDERLIESLCGLVGSLGKPPTDVFLAQWDAYMQQVDDQWKEWFNSVFDASFITGEQFQKRNLDVDRQLANLNAIADIDNRAIGNTGKFYDLFVGTNNMSTGVIDKSFVKTSSSLGVNDLTVMVAGNLSFSIGDEITLVGLSLATDQEPYVYRRIITNISNGNITINTPLGRVLMSGSMIFRSSISGNSITNKVTLDNWTSPSDGSILLDRIDYYSASLSFSDDKKYATDGVNIYKLNQSTNSYEIYISNGNQSGKLYGNDIFVKFFADNYSMKRFSAYIYRINSTTNSLDLIYQFDNNGTWVYLSTYMKGNRIYFIHSASADEYNHSRGSGLVVFYYDLITKTRYYFPGLNASYVQSITYDPFRDIIAVVSGSDLIVAKVDETTNTLKSLLSKGLGSGSSGYLPSPDGVHAYVGGVYSGGSNLPSKIIKWNNDNLTITNVDSSPFANNAILGDSASNATFSPDGVYLHLTNRRRIYTIIGGKLHLVKELPSQYASAFFTQYSNNLLVLVNSTTSGKYALKYLIGSSQYQINEIDLRYNFKQPIKNLAGWLFANQQLDGVHASLSLVDRDKPEEYKPLTVTQKGNEYEFLETTNLTTKDKATLKLTITGEPYVNKLLGAIE